MVVDEFYFHRKRGLSWLEALGHPIDTLLYGMTLAIPLVSSPGREAILLYCSLGSLSALIITKDEKIHAQECAGGEHWIHALLFVLHGPILVGIAYLWIRGVWPSQWFAIPVTAVSGWLLMQLALWLGPWAPLRGKNMERAYARRQ